ncbi:HD-GYP domain-containing protein [Sporomusa acidovorans]|uniref:3'3'-cGAMP-specific phosphodiesterase 1 n=1 Tax=Sporomusa acidovorans (strain ATCC 49682 / DSM 3132 / Mol) TaxID=1123286 RepID=A0ABZ3JAF0_SPOA4|nr:HD domain-containing phosphohydrolase [Sporomusa acidovorans]OZC13263.1 cyclic di-GMP phosphodiesterase response regulator RpfG [Sporomusa acidovorans DSM 3132]SDD98885.1 HD domain-containing protein [Sporomusa acidovorans]
MLFSIHPSNLVSALSIALELSTNGLSKHHWRTALISGRIAEHIGMAEGEQQLVVYAALLHDIGAASNWAEKRKLQRFKVSEDVYWHAEAGYELLKDSQQLGMLADVIRHHHDKWDGSNPTGLAGRDIPIGSRIINLADRLEILLRDNVYIFEQRPEVLSAIRKLSGITFDPDLVRELHEFARQESFWLDLTNPHYYQNFFRQIDAYGRMVFNIDDIVNIAEIFATIIDRTSRFTGLHSRGVAEVSAFLAQARGYSQDEIKLMKIAGLFHDLGKLSVPNEILEKPERLTDQEFSTIKQHPYYTYRILEQIDGFSLVAEWAAFHHETLDGMGYPFHIAEPSLKLGSRIVSVADVFMALSENRPYRQPLALSEVQKIMQDMANNRKLDSSVVADLFHDSDKLNTLVG